MSEKILKCEKFKLVAPDGGWGFLICIAAVLIYTITGGFYSCFGMMYNNFMTEIKMETRTMALVTGFNAVSFSISGFLTSLLLKAMTLRKLAYIAAVLYSCGAFCLIFAHSVISFFFCQSFMQSFAFGILYNLACTIVNDYFIERRLFAVGVIQTGTAVFTLFIPLLVKITLQQYAYHGMLLIISAISLHLFPAVTLMQPVKWHMKKVELIEENDPEMKVLLIDNNEAPTIQITDDELISTATENKDMTNNVSSKKIENDSILKKIINELFDVTLMKSFLPSYACLGLTVELFGDYIYSIMIPQALYDIGWHDQNVSWGISVIGFGDLSARIALMSFNKWLMSFGSAQLHLIGPITGIAARIGMLLCKDMDITLIFLALSGVSRCFLYTLVPIVIADEVGEKFTSAMGLLMLVMGVFNLGFGPAIGAVRDLTGNYDSVSWISIGFLLLGILIWCIEKYYKTRRQKEKPVK